MPKFKRPKNCVNCPYKSQAFSHLDKETLEQMQEKCLVVDFKKGETFAKQGTMVTHSLYLTTGLAKIFVEGKNKNVILKLIPPGKFIGLHSLFSQERIYNFSASAVVNSRVCMIPIDHFYNVARQNHKFLLEISHIISECTYLVFDKISSLNQKTARGRIAEILLYLADEVYHSNKFKLPITRRELAELAAISLENAVRILSDLKNEEVIKINDREFEILQRDILEKISIMS